MAANYNDNAANVRQAPSDPPSTIGSWLSRLHSSLAHLEDITDDITRRVNGNAAPKAGSGPISAVQEPAIADATQAAYNRADTLVARLAALSNQL